MSLQITKSFRWFLIVAGFVALYLIFVMWGGNILGYNQMIYTKYGFIALILLGIDFQLIKKMGQIFVLWSIIGYVLLYIAYIVYAVMSVDGEAAMGLAAVFYGFPITLLGFYITQNIMSLVVKYLYKSNLAN